MKIKKYLKQLKEIKENTEWTHEFKNFILYLLGYGLLVNYALWALLGIDFQYYTIPAYGIVYYLINEEFVKFIRKIRDKTIR